MQTLEAIRTRRSVKHYDANHQMTDDEKKEIISLAMLSPTAFNMQHWRFVVVEDVELRQEIRKVAWDQSQVTDASMLIVLCADMQSWHKNAKRCWQDADKQLCKTLCCLRLMLIIEINRKYSGMKLCVVVVSPRKHLCWLLKHWVTTHVPWMGLILMRLQG